MSIPPTELQDRMEAYYNAHIKVDTNKATIIQLETTQQSHDEVACHKWKAQRRERITSSNVGIIAKCRATTLVNGWFTNYCIHPLKATQQLNGE